MYTLVLFGFSLRPILCGSLVKNHRRRSRVRCGIVYSSKNRKFGNWPESGVAGRDVDQISLT